MHENPESLYMKLVAANQFPKEESYWTTKFAGEWQKCVFPYSRQNTQDLYRMGAVEFKFAGDAFIKLMKLSNDSDYRLYMIMTAALTVLINKYTGEKDIIIGSPTARQDHEGEFINSVLALRNQIDPGSMCFKDLLLQARQTIMEANENQNYPIERLLYHLGLNVSPGEDFPLFDIVALIENIHDKKNLWHIHYNMLFSFLRTPDTVNGVVEYNSALYDKGTIERIVLHYSQILSEILADINTKIIDIEMLGREEKERILFEFNDAEGSSIAAKTIHELFEEQAAGTPDNTAIVDVDGVNAVSYLALNQKANRLAGLLRSKGVKQDTIVGIIIDRSIDMVVGLLGILKAGGAYLAVDKNYPGKRIEYILEDSGVKNIVTNDKQGPGFSSRELTGLNDQEIEKFAQTNLGPTAGSMSLVYVIYTSGSTGNPKGVLIRHRGVCNLIRARKKIFGESPGCRMTQVASPGFDAIAGEIWPCLLHGASLYIVDDQTRMDPSRLKKWLIKFKITLSYQPTVIAMLLLKEKWPGETVSLRLLLTAGDRLTQYPLPGLPFRLYNLYGPTEDTVWTTWAKVGIDSEQDYISAPPIGKPIDNHKVYILDSAFKLQPIGAPGEIFISGDGLAVGYLNNPELTAERFIKYRSYRSNKTYINYKTGDLARWLNDGNIEFLGRIDHQVKVRGFRIELGEIESCLMKKEGVKDAVVVVREDEPGDKYICAYIVLEQQLPILEIREHLFAQLPEFMIPSYFVALEKIPLTPSGKIDRRALPEPAPESGDEYAPPRDEVEEKLVEIWKQTLKLEKVGIRDSYFNIGGDSIKIIKVFSMINEAFHSDLKVADLFTNETIEKLAVHLREQGRSPRIKEIEVATNEIEALKAKLLAAPAYWKDRIDNMDDIEDIYPMSFIEKGIVYHWLREPEHAVYHNQIVQQIEYMDFDPERFRKAVALMVEKHSMLRTTFHMDDIEEPIQTVHKEGKLDVVHIDLSGMDRQEQENYIKNYVEEDRRRPFNLSVLTLWRMRTFGLDRYRIVVFFACHHAIIDGWSAASFKTELNNIYLKLESEPGFVPDRLKSSYRDFIIEQLAHKDNRSVKDYWLQELVEYKRLRFDKDKSPYNEAVTKTFISGLGVELMEKLNPIVVQYNTTLKHLCFAAYMYMLDMASFANDVTAGLVTNNRPLYEDGEKILGCFLNTVPVRIKFPVHITWPDYIKWVDKKIKDLPKYDRLSLFEIVDLIGETGLDQNPVFDVMFNYIDFHVLGDMQQSGVSLAAAGGSAADGERFRAHGWARTNTLMDFTVNTTAGVFDLIISYSTGFLSEQMLLKLVYYFKKILEMISQGADAVCTKEDLISIEEKQTLLYDFNNTRTDYPSGKTIRELFAEQAEQTPDHIAVIGSSAGMQCEASLQVTYRELNEKSNRLANYLHYGNHVEPDQPVGIMMDRSLEMITAVLGILKAGGAYVPISPEYPLERIKKTINDAGIMILLSQKRYIKDLNWLQWECGTNLKTFLCIDSHDVYEEKEVEENQLMSRKLWEYVGETSVDEVTGGGWNSSYTGEPIPKEEMDEYGDNILKKLAPLLHKDMRVLEIGAASGISMYRVAPRVGLYYGTDLSGVIIEKNKRRIKEEGHKNIKLMRIAAHEIDRLTELGEKNFDLVIINSVIQCFHGHNYLRKVIRKAIDMMPNLGYLFIGDIMDQDIKENLIADLVKFKRTNKNKNYKTKTDWSEELFISRSFLEDLAWDFPGIYDVEFSNKIYTGENELTRFRYDALIKIDKSRKENKQIKWRRRHKIAHDLRILKNFGTDKLEHGLTASDLAYIIYTSGSTGIPKGVMVEHRNVVRLVKNTNFIRFKPGDRILQTGALEFDASTFEIWGALLNGLTLVLETKENLLEANILKEITAKHKITIMWMTSSFFNRVSDEDADVFGGLHYLLVGGEALSPLHINRLRSKFPALNIINGYGPTENTTFSTTFLIDREYAENIPIGGPIANSTAYVLDIYRHLLPIGVPGELYVGGDGVARGYLNNPGLTNDRFILTRGAFEKAPAVTDPPKLLISNHLPFTTHHSPLYKTGDLVRRLSKDRIQFLGRIDNQVKIRGYRIETQEIENRLIKVEGVKEAVVIDLVDAGGNKYLCAYIVIEEDVRLTELPDLLSKDLPGYMIPSCFIPIKSVPLTVNGKIDRKALPAPESGIIDGDTHSGYVTPRNKIEKKLVEIWNDILSQPHHAIGIDDNFFQLGGHSLKATQLTARIHRIFNTKISLGEIFKAPTIRGIASAISKTGETAFKEIKKAEKKDYYELSFNQKRLWFIQQLNPTGSAYNMPGRLLLNHHVEDEWIAGTLDRLAQRHESMRTGFKIIDDRPVQRIAREVSIPLKKIDISMFPNEEKQRKQEEIFAEMAGAFFDLMEVPLIRAVLLKLDQQVYEFMFNMHHIITDGWSMEIIKRDFTQVYEAYRTGETIELQSIPFQYTDFVEWNNGRLQDPLYKAVSHSYWKTKLGNGIPEFKLPGDLTGGQEPGEGAGYYAIIEKDITERIERLAEHHNTTLFTVMFSVYMLLLARLSGEDEVVCSIISAGREHSSLQPIVGFFVNSIIYDARVNFKTPFDHFLERVKEDTLELFQNQDYPLELVFEELGMRYPEISVTFNMLSMRDSFAGKEPEPINNPHVANSIQVKFDLEPYITKYKNGLQIYWSYKKNMFRPGTIAYIAGEYARLLDYFSRNSSENYIDYRKSRAVDQMMPARTAVPLAPESETLVQVFERQVSITPSRVAVKERNSHYTYDALNRDAGRAAYLTARKLKLKQNERVGLLFEHGYDMIAAIIGTLKAGKTYVPLSASYPLKRLLYMLSDSGSSLLLTNRLNLSLAAALAEENHIEIGNIHEYNPGAGKILLENPAITSKSPAYILYTSGSTGNPKGVVQNHENVLYYTRNWGRVFSISCEDKMTLFSSFCHDGSVQDMFGALLNGATLYPYDMKAREESAPDLSGFLNRERITIWHSVPSLFAYFLNSIDAQKGFPGLRFILLGGEPLRAHEVVMAGKYFPHTTLANIYGQTESSVTSTWSIPPANREKFSKVIIGEPLDNTGILLLDEEQNIVAPLETGEIVVACPHLSLGYWQNEEAAQKVFSIHPLFGKIYRTGDMGRLLLDGGIEFIGRKDSQVKIRGFRIELGEIESRLLENEYITEAVVKVIEPGDDIGDKYLAAYIVCNINDVSDEELSSRLKIYLADLLPDYMIPAYFIRLERMPLTPGGKVDRKALPLPDISRMGELNRNVFVVPCTWIEIKLQEIWSDVLKIPGVIGIKDDFFQLGGHSLRATALASRIQKTFNVKVPLMEIFKRQTIEGLARYINGAAKEGYASLEPVEKKDYYPLSPAQKRLYILHRMESESANYNLPQVIPFAGAIDIERIQWVFKELIRRHESLRTSFAMVEGDPVQKIHDEVEFEIEVFSGVQGAVFSKKAPWLPTPGGGNLLKFIQPFDLSQAPLLRATIIKDVEGKSILLVDMHHIITDGTSNRILKNEFNMLLSPGNKEGLAPLRLQYKEYAHWQNSEVQRALIKDQETYWLNMFSKEVPVLNLPTDYPRPAIQGFEGSRVDFMLNVEESGALKGLAKETGVTLYMCILSAFTILLSRLSGQEDIVVGTPVAGRRHTDLEKIIGMFVNTLALRNNVPGEMCYSDFVKELKDRTLKAYENQEYQFESLVEKINVVRDIGRNPLFDVMFNLLNMESDVDITLPVELENPGHYIHREGTSRFDLTLTGVDVGERVYFSIEYCTRLFKPAGIERFISYFKKVIAGLAVNTGQRLSEIEIIPQEERNRILYKFNDTAAEYPANKTIHQLFEEQALKTPDRVGLVGNVRPVGLTYKKLNEQSDLLAGSLIEKGVLPDNIIGIMMERSVEMVIAIFGILKAGGAYLPIDPDYPKERIDYMLKDSGSQLLLTIGNIENVINRTYLSYGSYKSEKNPTTNLAYVIYTSGSTGYPKGVMIEHASVLNFIEGMEQCIDFKPGKKILALTTISFDIFGLEVLLPLCKGLEVVMVNEEHQRDVHLLQQLILKSGVEMLQATPTRMQMLIENENEHSSLRNLKEIMVGGEALPGKLNADLAQLTTAQIYNMYGPTETTIWSTVRKLNGTGSITIGKPVINTQVYILSKYLQIQPVGIPGEMYIGGNGVARGYLNRPELTAERFDQDLWDNLDDRDNKNKSFSRGPGPRGAGGLLGFYKKAPLVFYKTGDLARWLEDGGIEFLGRIDYQVKVKGFRIELEEIEKNLKSHENVKDAVVTAEGEGMDQYLCAYIVSPVELRITGLKEYLARKLPGYMVPSSFIKIDKIPFNLGGKIDRNALRNYRGSRLESGAVFVEPATDIEKTLATLWKDVLKLEKVGIYDNFFELGGNSLKVVQLNDKLREIFKIEIPVAAMFRYLNIDAFTKYLNEIANPANGQAKKTGRMETLKQSARTYKDAVKRYRKGEKK